MLSYEEAYKIIKDELAMYPKDVEQELLLDSLGRYLAEDVASDINMPPFNNSAMDGFAVKYHNDINSWTIIGEIAAGNYKEFKIESNQCISIMTGARIPDSADTVIPIEDVEVLTDSIKLLNDAKYKKGMNVRLKAEDLKIGKTVLKKNTKIQNNNIPMLASCGMRTIPVYKKLKIGAMTTGDELVDIDFKPEGDQIRASNLYSILQEIKSTNCLPINFGFMHDDRNSLKTKLSNVLSKDIDILVTSGAVSVGKYDFLKDVLEELGAVTIFWKVNIKPGKPLLFCKYSQNGKTILIFGLPGNPVSTFVNYQIFIKRAIDEIYGEVSPKYFSAILGNDIVKNDGKRHFIRGFSEYDFAEKQTLVSIGGPQSSGNLFGLNNSNCLIIVEEESTKLEKGETVTCIKI